MEQCLLQNYATQSKTEKDKETTRNVNQAENAVQETNQATENTAKVGEQKSPGNNMLYIIIDS